MSSDGCFRGKYVLADPATPPPYQLPQAHPYVADVTSPYLSKRCAGNEDWEDWRWAPSSSQCAAELRGRQYYDVCARLRGRWGDSAAGLGHRFAAAWVRVRAAFGDG